MSEVESYKLADLLPIGLTASVPALGSGLVISHIKEPLPSDCGNGIIPKEDGLDRANRLAWKQTRQPHNRQLMAITMYRADVVVTRKWTQPKQVGGGKRGKVTDLSDQSLRRMVFTARNIEGMKTLLTLTYPEVYPTDGLVVKGHWRRMRRWLVSQGLGGFWFLEFQQRGAPHFHIFLNGRIEYQKVAETWYKIVDSGDEKHLRAGTRIERIRNEYAAGSYAQKYAAKKEQKRVPDEYLNVGRFWGTFGGVAATAVGCVSEADGGYDVAQRIRIVRNLAKAVAVKQAFKLKKDKGRFRKVFYGLASKCYTELSALVNPTRFEKGRFRQPTERDITTRWHFLQQVKASLCARKSRLNPSMVHGSTYSAPPSSMSPRSSEQTQTWSQIPLLA